MSEIQLRPGNPYGEQELPPGYKCECVTTFNDSPYTVRVCSVDLKSVVSGIKLYSYSKSDTLIKYSEARFSPVSSEPADCIQLATPSYYRNLETAANSELIADDLEGAYIETLNWRNRGSVWMEALKEKLTASQFNFRNHLSAEITWARKDFWIYCTSIDPNISYKRKKQMKCLAPSHNFMTKIEKPSEFAKQLGRDVGKQTDLYNDLKYAPSALYISNLIDSILGKQSRDMADYLISVNHGPVIYLDEDEIEKFINNIPKGNGAAIIPFVKRRKYKEQQEYRFVVSINCYSPNKDTFYLKVSDELRNLMAPMENVFSRNI